MNRRRWTSWILLTAFLVVLIHAFVPHHHHDSLYELWQSPPEAAADHSDHHDDHAGRCSHAESCDEQPLDIHHVGSDDLLTHYQRAHSAPIQHLNSLLPTLALPPVVLFMALLHPATEATPSAAWASFDTPPLLRPAYVGPTGCHSPPVV